MTSFFPLNLIGVTLTNILTSITQKVEEGLENFRHLDNVVLPESKDGFTPLIGSKGDVLSPTFNLDRRVFTETLSLRSLVITEEGTSHKLVASSLLCLYFNILFNRIITLFESD